MGEVDKRKNEDEEGQLPSDDESLNEYDLDKELGSDNSLSEENYNSGSDTTLSSTVPSEAEKEMDDKKIEMIRRRRTEIRQQNRRRKPAADIADGEVDSDGEHFEPMEESKDPKIRMILHHLPKGTRTKRKIPARKDGKNAERLEAEAGEDREPVLSYAAPLQHGANILINAHTFRNVLVVSGNYDQFQLMKNMLKFC